MAAGRLPDADAGSVPPPSDPALEGATAEWSDRLVPDRPLSFAAEGKVSTRTWVDLVEVTIAAFKDCGLELAEIRAPPYSRKELSYLGATRGYGYILGESDLRTETFGFLQTKGYRSFIGAVQAWVDPPLTKSEVDTEQALHRWIVRVRAGYVHSVEVQVRYESGPTRQFRGTMDTDRAYTWIAPGILKRIADTAGK